MNRKKIVIQVYMMNGSSIEIAVESFSNVKKCVILCLMQLGMQEFVYKSEHFTLLEYIRLHNGQKIERYLDDSEKVSGSSHLYKTR